jgi:GTP-binding protein
LHIVDVLPLETDQSPVEAAQKILVELKRYDEDLFRKPRWLVLNKIDLIGEDEQAAVCDEIIKGLDWSGPVYQISAINKLGVDVLCNDIMSALESDEQAAL